MTSSGIQRWEEIQHGLQHISEAISVIVNSFLVFLIINKSPKKLGSYKYLMIYISDFEILYSFVDFVVAPFFYSYGPALLVIVNLEESLFNKPIAFVLLCSYSGFFGTSMAIFGIHFIYRYLVATGSLLLATFSTWKIVLWLSFPIFYGVVWGAGSYFLCAPSEYTTEFVRENILNNFNLQMEDIAYFGLNFYGTDNNGKQFIVYEQVVGIVVNSFIITSSLSTAVYFGVKTYYKINELTNKVSLRTSNLQSQLLYSLVVQTMIPVILMHIPVTIIYTFAFMGHGMGTICGIASITISMYPALDPLPTIFIIKNYRNYVLNMFSCCSAKYESENNTASREAAVMRQNPNLRKI
ncbi:Serpentine receptor class r-10 [Caenorhabditis elegans]|uniref:Serpentine receptor class r-10 n=1 Tax=Caenorhabditis elegans TaxID=6239 RepID=O17973_CAEEL|nr:Seven TM Receptor [Caenorhabditis elegans]CAA92751.3 Seven TM Receptor [Caenorhabditis elegans]|eukprot:NP_502071.2 Seven TM Receptor [Caenorhabditis elegans]